MSSIKRIILAGLALAAAPLVQAQTEMKPQWEIGAGFAAIDFPIYRGASEHRSYLLPVPYFIYRGDVVQINRERIRGLIFRKDRVEMDVSVNGSVPANSNDSIARRGMPNLDPTFEIGPSLNTHLYYSEDKKTTFDIRMPLRTVVASNFKRFKHVGWLFQPQLNFDVRDISGNGWNLGVVGGLIYSDRNYHSYFYDVAPQFATATRPAYTANGGYSGTQFILALNKRYPEHWVGGFMKWDDLSGATFVNSPLVTSKQYFTVGFAVTWMLDHSDTMVEVNND